MPWTELEKPGGELCTRQPSHSLSFWQKHHIPQQDTYISLLMWFFSQPIYISALWVHQPDGALW